MRNIFKWEPNHQRYVRQIIPENWYVSCYELNMNTKVNCVSCGKEMTFGDGYTSRIFQTAHGIGYCECENCYERHLEEEE